MRFLRTIPAWNLFLFMAMGGARIPAVAAVIRIDAGPETSAVAPHFEPLTPATRATAAAPGWVEPKGISAQAAAQIVRLKQKPGTPPAGPLFSDFLYGASPVKLRIPTGTKDTCDVVLITGHLARRSLEVDFRYSFQDGTGGQVYVYPATGNGRAAWYTRRHRVSTPDGVLELTFEPKTLWSLVGLVVVPAAALRPETEQELSRLDWQARMLPDADGYIVNPDPENATAGEPFPATPAEKAAGAVTFWRPPPAEVFAREIPAREEIGLPARGFDALGETAEVSFAVHALADLQDLRIAIEPLRNEQGREIPVAGVRVLELVDLPALTREELRADGVEVLHWREEPICLHPLHEPFSLGSGRNGRFRVAVRIPRDQAAGVYKGEARVLAGTAQICQVPLHLRVLPFELVDSPFESVSLYYRPTIPSLQDAEYRDLAEHGITSIILRSMPERTGPGTDGPERWDFSPLEADMDQLRAHGLNAPMAWLVGSRLGVWTVTGDRKEFAYTPELEARVDNFCRQLAAFLKTKPDWPQLYLIFNDEPSRDWHVALARRSTEIAQRYGLKSYCQANGVSDFDFLDSQGVLLYYPRFLEPLRTAPSLHAKGQKLWINTFCLGVPTNSASQARAWYGFMPWKEGADGVSSYAYSEFRAVLRNALTPCHTAYFLGPDGRPMPTLAWEAVRAGLKDARHAVTLEQTLERARKDASAKVQALARDAEAALQAVRERLAEKHFSGVAAGNLPALRWHLASWTLRLREAMLGNRRAAADPAVPPPGFSEMRLALDSQRVSWRSLLAPRAVECPRLTATPTLDGRLDDDAWRPAARVELHPLGSGDVDAARLTTVRIGRDASHLYLAFHCLDPEMARLEPIFTEGRDKAVWDEDCVEIFLDVNHDGETSLQWLVNAAGVITDARNTMAFAGGQWRLQSDRSWDSGMRVGTGRDAQGWTVECAIPFADLEVPVGTWGLQLGREYGRKGDSRRARRFYIWNPTRDQFGNAAHFGDLHFADSPVRFTELMLPSPVFAGRNEVRCRLVCRPEALEKAFTLRSVCRHPETGEVAGTPVQISPGRDGRAEYVVPFTLPSPGRWSLAVECSDSEDRIVLRSGTVTQIAPALAISLDHFLLIGGGDIDALIDVAFGAGPTNRLGLNIVGEVQSMWLGEVPLTEARQNAALTLRGLQLAPGEYRLRAEVRDGDNAVAAAEQTFTVTQTMP